MQSAFSLHLKTSCVMILLLVSIPFSGKTIAAADYPTRPVRMIVAFAPGGVSDITARVVAQKMSSVIGQTIVVDNRGGAGGTLGSAIAAKATPDGYTLVFSSLTAFAIGPNMRKSLPYEPVKDFTAIGGISVTPNILVMHPSLPFQGVKGLVAYAKSNPNKLSFGSSGIGSTGHLTGEVLRMLTGIQIVHVPYKSAGLAYPDLFSGTIGLVFDSLPSAIQHIRSGKIKAVGLLSDKRSPLLPDTSTFAEEGYPAATLRFWNGLHGPAGLPPAIVGKLNKTLNESLAAPDLVAKLADLGAVPYPTTPRELAQRHQEDILKIAKTVKSAGIQPE